MIFCKTVILFGVVNAISNGKQFCHKTIKWFTPEEFVNKIICNNEFYKQLLFKKVSSVLIQDTRGNIYWAKEHLFSVSVCYYQIGKRSFSNNLSI